MPNTYTQLYIHIIYAVKYRDRVISKSWKESLNQYTTGIIQKNGHKLLAINGASNHLHVFIGVKPHQAISGLIQDVKAGSSKWINDNKFVLGHFSWQAGYAAFSYSHSQIDQVIKYINNQEQHHAKRTFREEYLELLNKFEVEYNDAYLFDFFE
jgi:REP element-mobilizing transposase RayT